MIAANNLVDISVHQIALIVVRAVVSMDVKDLVKMDVKKRVKEDVKLQLKLVGNILAQVCWQKIHNMFNITYIYD